MNSDKALKDLQKMKKDLQDLEKRVIREQGMLDQEVSKMQELGYGTIEELREAITKMKEAEAKAISEAEELLQRLKEEYADFL